MKHQLLALTVAAVAGCSSNPYEPPPPNPAALTITPGSEDFLDASVGTTSARVIFTVRNTGGSPTGSVNVTLTGLDAGQFHIANNECAITPPLAPGVECVFTAFFVPSGPPGVKSASLHVQGSPTVSASAAIQGTILPVSTTVGISPATHDFGYAGNYDFTVTNSGGAASGTLNTYFSGPNAADFNVFTTDCPASLGAGASCVITVRFRGSDVSVNVSAWLNVTHPGGAAPPAYLTGTGV